MRVMVILDGKQKCFDIDVVNRRVNGILMRNRVMLANHVMDRLCMRDLLIYPKESIKLTSSKYIMYYIVNDVELMKCRNSVMELDCVMLDKLTEEKFKREVLDFFEFVETDLCDTCKVMILP